jgi:hypothetical protein
VRKFFYLCAALLCLSLAFHFGYTTARAQVGTTVWSAAATSATGAVLVGRTICWANPLDGWSGSFPPVPGASQIVAIDVHGYSDSPGVTAVVEAGIVYYYGPATGHGWVQASLPCVGPTPVDRQSWGQLKSRYRAAPAPTPGMTVTPGANDR